MTCLNSKPCREWLRCFVSREVASNVGGLHCGPGLVPNKPDMGIHVAACNSSDLQRRSFQMHSSTWVSCRSALQERPSNDRTGKMSMTPASRIRRQSVAESGKAPFVHHPLRTGLQHRILDRVRCRGIAEGTRDSYHSQKEPYAFEDQY